MARSTSIRSRRQRPGRRSPPLRRRCRPSRPRPARAGPFYSLPELAQQFPECRAAAGLDPHRARVGAAQLRRQEGHDRACRAARQLAAERRAQRGDSVRRRARRAAGLHRRAAAGRPGGDAQRRRRMGKRPEGDRAAGAGRPGRRPQRDGRPLRQQAGARPEHEARVQAQRGALRIHEMGHAGLRHLPRRAAGLRHRPSGQPRISGARRAPRARPPGAATAPLLLPRHAGRHRQPHDDDQRHRRRRLGRRRHRGRGRHARPAGLFPDARTWSASNCAAACAKASPRPTWC